MQDTQDNDDDDSDAQITAKPAAVPVSKGGAPLPTFESLGLLHMLWALLAWLKVMLGLGRAKTKKRKAKPCPPPPAALAEVAPPPPQQQPLAPAASKVPAAAASKVPVAASSKVAEKAPAKQAPEPVHQAKAEGAEPGSTPAKPPQQQQQQRHQPAPPAPATMLAAAPITPSIKKPTGPASECDRDWQRGRFHVSVVQQAHGDVVSCLALAGDLAVSGGYDGAVKVHVP